MREFLAELLEANMAAAIAVAFVLALRGDVRRRWGAHAAYLMWAVVPVAMLATLIPARTVVVQIPAPSPAFESPEQASAAAAGASAVDWMQIALSALPWLWAAGLAATAAWLLLGQARFLGDVRRGRAGPAVVGLIRPHIVIPSDFGGRFAAREQELILAHEHFHLARHDARLNTLVALARCVCWFNPMIHVGAHAMRIDQELSCDAAVVGRRPGARRAYAEALLKTQLAARPLPLGCYWPAGTQHPLTERIAMLTRNTPSRRTRLLASAGIVLVATGAGIAAWAAQPEQVVVEAQLQQPAPLAPVAPRAPLPPLDRGAAVPAPETPPTAPTPPAPPVPSARGFASVPAPEAPPAPSARNRLAAAPPLPTAPAPLAVPPVPPAPAVAPAPAPAPAPQQLSQAERDELLRRLEVQRREMEVQLKQLEAQRRELDLQRKQLEVERQRLNLNRPRPEPSRAVPAEPKFDSPARPFDEAAAKKMFEAANRYKAAAARAQAMDGFLIRNPDGTIRNKVVLGQIDKSFPFDSDIARARAAAEKRKIEQAAREKQADQPK